MSLLLPHPKLQYRKFFIAFVAFIIFGGLAVFSAMPRAYASATYYISPTGSDSGNGSAAQPWATFNHAWTGMTGGDTLIVENGTYSQQVRPPASLSGTAAAYTTIKAQTTWGATVDGSNSTPAYGAALQLDGQGSGISYVQVMGIKFASGPNLTGGQEPVMVDMGNHIKLQKIAGYNAPCNNNTAVIDITNSSYALVEDSHAWGCGRYKFLAFESSYVIFRHDVARHDSTEVGGTWGRQNAQFTMYNTPNVLMQNDIAIDSGAADASTGNLYGGIWSENNAGVDNSGKYEGDILINLKTGTDPCCYNGASINDPKLIGTREISNVAIINSTAGIWADREDSTAVAANLLINHITAVNITGSNPGSGNAADGVGVTEVSNANFSQKLTENSILQNDNSFGIAEYMTSNNNIFYNNPANFGTVSYQGPVPTAGANDKLGVNPLLKYPLRVEAGSPAKGAASDGGDIGATILDRIGVPGTLWGDPGYDTLTSIPLWPWDDEAVIKSDMASYTGQGALGTRGFAAPGNGLYGGPITLTSYIWESLGYPCPPDICNYSGVSTSTPTPTLTPDTQAPSTPSGLIMAGVTTSTVSLSWIASTDNVGVAGYRIYRNGTQITTVAGTSFKDSGLLASTNYTYTVAAYDAAGNVSGQSAGVTATTQALPTTPTPTPTPTSTPLAPPTISSFSATPTIVGSNQASTLNWSISNASSVTIGPIAYSTTALSGSISVIPTSTMTYTITATNKGGSVTASTAVTVDAVSPTVPASVVATATGSSTITLSWAASTDVGTGVGGYSVFRCTGSPCTPQTKIGTTSALSYKDIGLAPSSIYSYAVAAYDKAGNVSANSSVVQVTTLAVSSPVPPTPTSTTPTPTSTTSAPVGPAGYTFCANEYATCSFSGTMSVAFGLGSSFNYLTLTNGTACTVAVFGDPAVGADKFCFIKPTAVSTPTSTPPSSSATILQLLAQIQNLRAQVDHTIVLQFTRNLSVGASGADVQYLQIFLNLNGSVIASTGAGSPGNESTYFGWKTSTALSKFQSAYGLSASGRLDDATRAFLQGRF